MRVVSLVFALLLSACVAEKAQFHLPQQVVFQGKSYQQTTDNQIDKMRQALFLLSDGRRDPDNWQQGILLFTDQTHPPKSLAERVNLRQTTFAQQADTQANVAIVAGELQSQVIYPPTERFRDYQLEVSRGRDSQCGYSQMQFSLKYAVNAEKSADLGAYWRDLTQLSLQFMQLPWQIECK